MQLRISVECADTGLEIEAWMPVEDEVPSADGIKGMVRLTE